MRAGNVALVVEARGAIVIDPAMRACSRHDGVQRQTDSLSPCLTMVDGVKPAAQTSTKDFSQLFCYAGLNRKTLRHR